MAIWSIMDVSSWGMSHPAIMKMMVLQIGWKISLSLHVLSEIQSINALLGKSSPIFREFNTACKINIIPNAIRSAKYHIFPHAEVAFNEIAIASDGIFWYNFLTFSHGLIDSVGLGSAIASQKLTMISRLTSAYQHFRYDGSQEPEWAFVWSLTHLHSVSFSQSRVIVVKNYA